MNFIVKCGFAAVIGVAFLLTTDGAATAQQRADICTQPITPACISFEDIMGSGGAPDAAAEELALQRCKQDVEEYAERVDEYARCLENNAARAREAVREAEEFIACRMEGRDDC